MKRVLVTGATGFIGRHCLALLVERGWTVHAVSTRPAPVAEPRVEWHRADLLHAADVARVIDQVRPTHLLHLAWFVVPGKLSCSPENFRWVQASLELLRRFREAGGQRAMITGSGFEYDWAYGFCSERVTPTVPDTFYGACKNGLRMLLEAYAAQTGLGWVWPRIFFLYGPQEHPERVVPHVIRAIFRGERARTSHGNQVRDYLFVMDAADALVTMLGHSITGAVNVASGRPITLRDLLTRVASKLGGLDLMDFGAIPARATDAPFVVADVTRLTSEVGWHPKYDIDSGLDETIAWWRGRSDV